MRLGQPTLISKQRTPELPCTAKQGPRIYRTPLRINGLRPLLRVERISISCNVALGEPHHLLYFQRSPCKTRQLPRPARAVARSWHYPSLPKFTHPCTLGYPQFPP